MRSPVSYTVVNSTRYTGSSNSASSRVTSSALSTTGSLAGSEGHDRNDTTRPICAGERPKCRAKSAAADRYTFFVTAA